MKIATLGIIVRDGQVLFGLKKKGEIGTGTLNGPGGKQEPDESLRECLIRETQEELGITLVAKDLRKVAKVDFLANEIVDFSVYVFLVENFIGEPQETADMIPVWYKVEEMKNQNSPVYEKMLESDRYWLPKIFLGQRFSAKVYYKDRAKDFDRIEFLPFLE